MAQKGMKPSVMIKQRVGAKPKAPKTNMPKIGKVKSEKTPMPKKMTPEQIQAMNQKRALDKLMKKRMDTVKKTGVYPNYKTN